MDGWTEFEMAFAGCKENIFSLQNPPGVNFLNRFRELFFLSIEINF